MHWCISCLRPIMHSSCYQQGSSLGASTYSPSTPVLPGPVSLCQRTTEASRQRGVQGLLLWPTHMAKLRGIFGWSSPSPSAAWQLHCGAGTPVRRVPILGSGWCSSPGDLLAHWGITDHGESSQSPFSSIQFAKHHILPFCLKQWCCHIVIWLVLPFCKYNKMCVLIIQI